MADRKPLKVLPDSASGTGSGDSTGLGEFVDADTIGVIDGGTGLAAVGNNQLLTGHSSSTTGALTSQSNLTFDGSTLQVTGTLKVGVDDTGHDVQFFGASAGHYMLWDESADEMILRIGSTSTYAANTEAGNLKLVNAGSDTDNQSVGIAFDVGAGNVGAIGKARIDAVHNGTGANSDLVFATQASGTVTERMRIDSSGAVTKPTNPAFMTRYASAASNVTGDGESVTINGGTEVFDNGGNVSSGLFTAPVAGTYAFQSNIYLEQVGSSHTGCYHSLITTGTSRTIMGGVFQPYNHEHANGALAFTNSWIIEMAANDVAKVVLQVHNGTTIVDIMGSTNYMNTFSGFLVG
jgi:hypothetical protein